MLATLLTTALLVSVAAAGKCTSPVIIPAAGSPGPRTLLQVVQQCDCGGSTGDSQYQQALALCRANIDLIRARTWNATCHGIADYATFMSSQCCDALAAGVPLALPKECTNEEERQRKKDKAESRNQKMQTIGMWVGIGVAILSLPCLVLCWKKFC